MVALSKRLHSGHLRGPEVVLLGNWAIVRVQEPNWRRINDMRRPGRDVRLHIVACTSAAASFVFEDYKRKAGHGTLTGLSMSILQENKMWGMGYRIPAYCGRRAARRIVKELERQIFDCDEDGTESPVPIENLRYLYR